MNMSKIINIFVLFMFFFVPFSYAHKVSIFAWVEGDVVYTESKFLGGKKPQNAVVEVYDENGIKLLQGKTDENGAYSFKAPVKAKMKVVLVAGMGHGNAWTIPADAFGIKENENSINLPVQSGSSSSLKNRKENETEAEKDISIQPGLTQKDIQEAVERALDKKLHPVISRLNQFLQEDGKPSIPEILSAIGYIIGLVGLGTYVNYRKKEKNSGE